MTKLLQAIFCLLTFATLCFAGDPSNNPAQKKLDLGSLEKGLRQYLNFDGSILVLSPEGAETSPDFTRNSEAWTPNLEKAEPAEPRFMPGKFGQGILIEYGSCSPDPDAGKNLLPTKTLMPLDGATLTPAEGPGGMPCVKISGERPGISIETNKLAEAKNLNFSVYLKGDKGGNVTVGTAAVTLDGNWQRVEQNYTGGLTIRSEKPFFAAAPMLEKLGSGYAGKSSASTWMPPFQTRPGDRLELPALTKTDSGTLSFWFKTLGKSKWRRLLGFDNSLGWEPLLAVDLKDGQTMTVGKSKVKVPKPLDDNNWHQLVLRWEGKRAELFIDNVKNGETEIPLLAAPIHLGGTSNGGSPGLRADALFDEFTQWDRALSDAEIAKLNALPGSLGDGLLLPLRLHDLEPVSVYPRDNIRRNWNMELRNLGDGKLDGLTLAWGIDGLFRSSRKLAPLGGKSKTPLSLEWSPALLLPGKYCFFVEVAGISYKKAIEISPARVPQENVQTIIWGGNGREYQELGVTTAGVGAIKGAEVAEANRNGLYSMVKIGIQGKASEEGDFMLGISGKPHNTDQRAPGALASLKFQAGRLGEELSRFPDIRAMIINTEHLWVDGLDFRKKTIREAREKFGLDLSKWLACPEKDRWKATPPGGRLAPSMGGITRPPEGILPLNDPLYSYMRWWHSGQAGNEIFLNDLVATTAKAHAPWVKSIVEPALRRPAVRAFKSQDILEEWFYYENPLTAISVQEKLAAAARGSGSQIAGMPQFLFKPGTAAPYMSMPAPHLFRETMWLCLSRPLRDFTFWGMWMALHPEKGAITQEEIDKELKQRLSGKEISFDNVKAVVKTQGESSDFSLFVPELRDEIGHMLNDVVNPLGALLPQWRNRPRQMAVYISFAGQIHSEIRWPRPSTLLEALPYPYDVLYDQDFEDNPDLLRDYQVLILQECAAVTSVAAPQLERFAKRGGLLLADEWYKGTLKEAFVINYGKSDPTAEKKLKARHDELISLYKHERHPQYIEGMEQAMADVKTGAAPVAQAMAALRKRFAPEVEVSNGNVRFNTLTAAGADYLVAVNDLRTKGRFFGQYGRLLENGLPLDGVTFRMSRKFGKAAYELLACRELSVKDAGDNSELSVDLPPAGGRIIVFLPEKIKELRLNIPNESRRGEIIRVKGELLGESGKAVPGIIPAKLELIRPDGSIDCFSHYCGIKDGRLTFELPIPLNSPTGPWRISLRELASGKEASGTISVK